MNVKKFFADLSSNGFAVMPNFWKAEKCDNLANKVRILMNEVDIKKTYENERYLVNSILNKKLNIPRIKTKFLEYTEKKA